MNRGGRAQDCPHDHMAQREIMRRRALGDGSAVDRVGVSGARVLACTLLWPCLSPDECGCGSAGTTVCVELLDAGKLGGLGED